MFFCLIHVSLCCGLMDSCMFTTDGWQTWDTGQNFLKLTSPSLSLPFHCILDRLWTCAGCNKAFNADCVGSSDLEKFDLGVLTRSLPFPLWWGEGHQKHPLYTNIIFDKRCSSCFTLHPRGSSLISKLLQINDFFLPVVTTEKDWKTIYPRS